MIFDEEDQTLYIQELDQDDELSLRLPTEDELVQIGEVFVDLITLAFTDSLHAIDKSELDSYMQSVRDAASGGQGWDFLQEMNKLLNNASSQIEQSKRPPDDLFDQFIELARDFSSSRKRRAPDSRQPGADTSTTKRRH